jgi:hypothetical protein
MCLEVRIFGRRECCGLSRHDRSDAFGGSVGEHFLGVGERVASGLSQGLQQGVLDGCGRSSICDHGGDAALEESEGHAEAFEAFLDQFQRRRRDRFLPLLLRGRRLSLEVGGVRFFLSFFF